MNLEMSRAWMEVDLEKIRSNYYKMRSFIPSNIEIISVLKANASSMGASVLALNLEQIGISCFAVATLSEAISLRMAGVTSNILILGYVDPDLLSYVIKYDLTITIVSFEHALKLNRMSKSCHIKCHVKVDTGMTRLGIDVDQKEELIHIYHLPHLKIEGIYSHLSVSDSLEQEDIGYTWEQIEKFDAVLSFLNKEGIVVKNSHLYSSYGVFNAYPLKYDSVRLGYAIFGIYSDNNITKLNLELENPVTIKARITSCRSIKQGQCVSYGRNYVASSNKVIATVGIGYADGIPRSLSNKNFEVLLHGKRCPIIGNICMDQLMIDISDILNVSVGDEVTFIGKDQDDEVTLIDMALCASTISNELLCRIGSRLPRIYLHSCLTKTNV